MAWEREFEVLEEAIRRVSAEYDAFLYGSAPKPPVESRKHVEQMIRRLSAVTFDAAADRYRFSTLQGRYSSLNERWERLQGEKEAGRRPGLYGHFGPAAPVSSRTRGVPPGPAAPIPNATLSRSVEPSEGARRDRELFETYISARRARGENVEGYVFETFVQSLDRERAALRERLGAQEVTFEVAERDGKVKLVARRGEDGAGPGGKK
jgi:hypothetical protein